MRSNVGLILLLTALYLLHNDFWFWGNPETVLGGLPIGLAYHVGYCLLISCFWIWVVRRLGRSSANKQQ